MKYLKSYQRRLVLLFSVAIAIFMVALDAITTLDHNFMSTLASTIGVLLFIAGLDALFIKE